MRTHLSAKGTHTNIGKVTSSVSLYSNLQVCNGFSSIIELTKKDKCNKVKNVICRLPKMVLKAPLVHPWVFLIVASPTFTITIN